MRAARSAVVPRGTAVSHTCRTTVKGIYLDPRKMPAPFRETGIWLVNGAGRYCNASATTSMTPSASSTRSGVCEMKYSR